VRKHGENFYVSHSEKVVLFWSVEPISKNVYEKVSRSFLTDSIGAHPAYP
jgi:hypothetical protein